MKHNTPVSMFRKFERLHDEMMRAAMPRTSAADPVAPAARRTDDVTVLANRLGVRLVKPLTFKLAEVQ